MKDRFFFTKVHFRHGCDGITKFSGILAISFTFDLWFSVTNAQPLVFVGTELLPEVIELHTLFRGLGTDVP